MENYKKLGFDQPLPGATGRIDIVDPRTEERERLEAARRTVDEASRSLLDIDPAQRDEVVAQEIREGAIESPEEPLEELETGVKGILQAAEGGEETAWAMEALPTEEVTEAVETALDGGIPVEVVECAVQAIDQVSEARQPNGATERIDVIVGLQSVDAQKEAERRRDSLRLDFRDNLAIVTPEEGDPAYQRQRELIATTHNPMNDLDRRFGIRNREALDAMKQDAIDHLQQPTARRKGEALVDASGLERRPIVDISLPEETRIMVGEQVELRQRTFQEALAALDACDGSEAGKQALRDQLLSEASGTLYEGGILSRYYGKDALTTKGGYRDNASARGTLPDLFVGEVDIANYNQLQQKLQDVIGVDIDMMAELGDRVIGVASNMFAEGTQFMHATRQPALDAIVNRGGIAPRSMTLHGTERQGSGLHGAYVHLTAPGSVATEYGDVYIGIPVETVMKHSPRLQLESDYASNVFHRGETKLHQQEVMTDVTFNDPSAADMPQAFRFALDQMAQNKFGLRHTDIGQGQYNNFSFAATGEAGSAGNYMYPIDELNIYISGKDGGSIASRYPAKADLVASRTIMAADTDSLAVQSHDPRDYLELPTPDLNKPLRCFTPGRSELVAFDENSIEQTINKTTLELGRTESSLPMTVENIVPGKVGAFFGPLIKNGEDPRRVIEVTMKELAEGSARPLDWVLQYEGVKTAMEQAGVSAADVAASIPSIRLDEALGAALTLHENRGMGTELSGVYDSEGGEQFVRELAESLYARDLRSFAHRVDQLGRNGYVIRPDQEAAIQVVKQQIEEERRLKAEMTPDLSDMMM